jgi:hypothetical protein
VSSRTAADVYLCLMSQHDLTGGVSNFSVSVKAWKTIHYNTELLTYYTHVNKLKLKGLKYSAYCLQTKT